MQREYHGSPLISKSIREFLATDYDPCGVPEILP